MSNQKGPTKLHREHKLRLPNLIFFVMGVEKQTSDSEESVWLPYTYLSTLEEQPPFHTSSGFCSEP